MLIRPIVGNEMKMLNTAAKQSLQGWMQIRQEEGKDGSNSGEERTALRDRAEGDEFRRRGGGKADYLVSESLVSLGTGGGSQF